MAVPSDRDDSNFAEITPETKSFAHLKACVEFTRLMCARLAIAKSFDFAYERQGEFLSFAANEFLEFSNFQVTDDRELILATLQENYTPKAIYPVMAEAFFIRIVDTFIEYVKDIISICIFSSPQDFDIKKEFSVSELMEPVTKEDLILIAVAKKIEEVSSLNVPQLSKMLRRMGFIDSECDAELKEVEEAIRLRNKLSHAMGIRQIALWALKSGVDTKRTTVTEEEFISYYNNFVSLIEKIDEMARKKHDVWEGVRAFAPDLVINDQEE